MTTWTLIATQTPVAPSNAGGADLPVITGSAAQGGTLSCSSGNWAGTAPITYIYEWRRITSGADVILQTSASAVYNPLSADIGFRIKCVVTASNATGSAAATTAQTAVVTSAVVPSIISDPVLEATVVSVDSLVGSSEGTWSGALNYDFQWQSYSGGVWSNIADAVSYLYLPKTADIGKKLRCAVLSYNIAGYGAVAYSNESANVVAALTTVAPVLTLITLATDHTPDFTVKGTQILLGDIINFFWASDSGFTTDTGTYAQTFDQNEINCFEAHVVIPTFGNVTRYFRVNHARPSTPYTSTYSNIVSVTFT